MKSKKTQAEINAENTQDILEKKFLKRRDSVEEEYRKKLEKLNLEYYQLTNVMLEYSPEVKKTPYTPAKPDSIRIKITLFMVDVEYSRGHSKRYYKDFLNLKIFECTDTKTAGTRYGEMGDFYYYEIGYTERHLERNALFQSADTTTFQELISHFKDTQQSISVLIPFEGYIKKYIMSKLEK